MKKILITFFSATGNTAKIVAVIHDELKKFGAEIEKKDITSYDDRKDSIDLTPYHAVIFGLPVHAMRAPRIVREWLDTLDGQGKLCATFFTYGGFRVHPTHYSTREILENRGFDLVSSAEFLGKHTFNIGGWTAMENRPNESDFEVAKEFARQTYKRFTGADRGRPGEFDKTELTQQELDRGEKLPFVAITQLPSRMGADCSLCMICEELCPTHAMKAETGEMGDTSRSQTISTKLRGIAEQALTWLAGQQSYAPELYRNFGYRGTG